MVALDVDGVCLNWYLNVARHLDFPYDPCPSWYVDQVNKNWHKIANDVNFWMGLAPIEDPRIIDFPVVAYPTAVPEQWLLHRRANLYMLGFPRVPVLPGSNKLDICREWNKTNPDNQIKIMVDDKPSTVKSFEGTEIKCLQFYPSYARWEKVGEVITSLSEVKNFL